MTGRFSILIAIICFSLGRAHAVENLFSPCEKRLTVNPEFAIDLMPNQIAFVGQLGHHWETGMEDQIGWLIIDEQIRRKVMPSWTHSTHWLKEGDHVYILDKNDRVLHHGYFAQRRERVPPGPIATFETYPNLPRLYKDPELTEIAVDFEELRVMIFTMAKALVVRTQTQEEGDTLRAKLQNWHDRYLKNEADIERFVRVARLRAYEQAHFEVARKGQLVTEGRTGRSQHLDLMSGEFSPGDPYRAVSYFQIVGEKKYRLRADEMIFLLDKKGNVIAEGRIGSPVFPLTSTDIKKMEALEKLIAQNPDASVVHYEIRKLK